MDQEAFFMYVPDDEEMKNLGPGEILRRARENKNLTEGDISTALRITVSRIKAIENGEYDDFPGHTFIRGYLRSYAKEVCVSPDHIIQAFNRLNLKEPESGRPAYTPYKQPALVGSERQMRWVTYGVAAGLIILVASWWHSHRSHHVATQVAMPAQVEVMTDAPVIALQETESTTIRG